MWLNPQESADLVTFTVEIENFIFCVMYCLVEREYLLKVEAHSEPKEKSKIKLFAKKINDWRLVLAKF